MSTFSSNVLKVLRGSVAAQTIGLAVLPLLSRLYEPAAFGVFQAIISVLSVLLIASSLRLEIAILTVDDEELPILLTCTFWLCGITSGLVLAVVVAWSMLLYPVHLPVDAIVFILPILALVAGWVQVLSYLSLRREKFELGAKAKVAQAVGAAGAGLAIGAWIPSVLGLAFADVIGRLLQGWTLLRGLGPHIIRRWRPPIALVWRSILHRHRDLWRVSLPGALINAVGSAYTPVLMLLVFDARAAGAYAIAERILLTPVGLVASAASQVFMSDLAELGRRDPALRRGMLRRIVLTHFRIGILPAGVVFFVAPLVLPLLLGSKWTQAGAFGQALTPLVLMAFVAGPVNMALTVAGKQLHQLAWDIGRLVAVAGTWLIVWQQQWAPITAIWLHASISCACYGFYLIIADWALDEPFSVSRAACCAWHPGLRQ